MQATDEKILTYTISSADVGGYTSKPALATGSLTLQATDAASAQKAIDLLRTLAPAFCDPTMTATIRVGDLSSTQKIEDASPEMAPRWIEQMAAPAVGAFAPPAAPPAQPAAPSPQDAAEQAGGQS